MVRASRIPFRNFEFNIQRAEALARLDGYLEDILHSEGKRTIGAFLTLPKELMQSFEMDKLMKDFGKKLEEHFKTEMKKKGKQHFEDISKDIAKRLKPQVEKIAEIFQDLGLLMDQTLLEQALVVAVSAFEVYLREIAVSVISLNKSVRERFRQEINAELSLERLQDYKEDARRTQGEIVADRVRLETRSIKNFLRRLAGNQNVFGDTKTESKIRGIFEKRHIIIHRAGSVDPKYKKVTKYRGAIGRQVLISRRYVLNSIAILRELVNKVEASI